jgi:integrase
MTWADVDLDTGWWTIPGAISKNGQPHRVPLVRMALDVLKPLRETAPKSAVWVFTGSPLYRTRRLSPQPRGQRLTPPEEEANVAHRGRKAANFLSHGDSHHRSARSVTRKRRPFQPGLSFAFRGHDLRRTAATGMAEAGVPSDHISRVLNHIDGGPRATRVYDRYAYDREKRAALEKWERLLTKALAQDSETNEPTAGANEPAAATGKSVERRIAYLTRLTESPLTPP